MERVAVFVDAGYLFAQGSVALSGSKQPRSDFEFDERAVVQELKAVAGAQTGGLSLLRIYWYDGAVAGTPTAQQAVLAHTDDVKVRLGFVNSEGQQKGVDSLIVTDLVDLSRNRAICDAVLLSGDEDVRVGVQIAQTFGVRVHLLGISPSRGSQSRNLQQEADTTTEWDAAIVGKFLRPKPSPDVTKQPPKSAIAASSAGAPEEELLVSVAKAFVDSLSETDVRQVTAFLKGNRGVPPEFDRKLLPTAARELGRDLNQSEKRLLRDSFRKEIGKAAKE